MGRKMHTVFMERYKRGRNQSESAVRLILNDRVSLLAFAPAPSLARFRSSFFPSIYSFLSHCSSYSATVIQSLFCTPFQTHTQSLRFPQPSN